MPSPWHSSPRDGKGPHMVGAKRSTSGSPGACALLLASAFILMTLVPAHAERLPLPPAEQEKVNDAIDFGASLRAAAEPTRLRLLALAARGAFCVM